MKILIIRYKKSQNIFEGGEQVSQRNLNMLQAIAGTDNVVTYYVHDESKKRSLCDYLKGVLLFPFNYFFGLTPRRVRQICRTARDFDKVFIDRSIFGIIAKKLKLSGYDGTIAAFFHNLEPLYFKAKIKNPIASIFINKCVKANDRYCVKYADKIVALNKRDSIAILSAYGRKADILAPVAFKDKYMRNNYTECTTSARPLCLFLGSYMAPNNQGIEWFLKNVYPHVNIDVKIVGKGMDKLRKNYTIPDQIEIIANAPDLLPYFEQTDIMLLPIFSGSGMKVKTCESLMYGKNIIGTDEAFQGYELDYSRVGGKCNTAEEFITVIRDFESNPRPRFNEYSRKIFLEKYTEQVVLDNFRQIFY